MTYSQAFYKTKKHWWLIITKLNPKKKKKKKKTKQTNKEKKKKEHQRDTCWHDKVSHHAIVRWFYSQGGRHWSPQSCVGVHACMCVILHVPFCAWAEVAVDVCVVCVCVCVCVCSSVCLCANIHEAGSQRAPNWLVFVVVVAFVWSPGITHDSTM